MGITTMTDAVWRHAGAVAEPWLFVFGVLFVLGIIFARAHTLAALGLLVGIAGALVELVWWALGRLLEAVLAALVGLRARLADREALQAVDQAEAATVASWPQASAGSSAWRGGPAPPRRRGEAPLE